MNVLCLDGVDLPVIEKKLVTQDGPQSTDNWRSESWGRETQTRASSRGSSQWRKTEIVTWKERAHVGSLWNWCYRVLAQQINKFRCLLVQTCVSSTQIHICSAVWFMLMSTNHIKPLWWELWTVWVTEPEVSFWFPCCQFKHQYSACGISRCRSMYGKTGLGLILPEILLYLCLSTSLKSKSLRLQTCGNGILRVCTFSVTWEAMLLQTTKSLSKASKRWITLMEINSRYRKEAHQISFLLCWSQFLFTVLEQFKTP